MADNLSAVVNINSNRSPAATANNAATTSLEKVQERLNGLEQRVNTLSRTVTRLAVALAVAVAVAAASIAVISFPPLLGVIGGALTSSVGLPIATALGGALLGAGAKPLKNMVSGAFNK